MKPSALSPVLAILLASLEAAQPPDDITVSPRLISTEGGTRITATKSSGTFYDTPSPPPFQVYIGGKLATIVSVTKTRIIVTSPPLAAGFHRLTIRVNSITVFQQDNVFEAAPPPKVIEVLPSEIPFCGSPAGQPVLVKGTDFREGTVILLGNRPLLEPTLNPRYDIVGYAPALDCAESAGKVDVSAGDSRGTTVLREGATYVDDRPAIEKLEPDFLRDLGGDRIRILGRNFTARTEVTLEAPGSPRLPLVVDYQSPGLLVATVPSQATPHAPGLVSATVTYPGACCPTSFPDVARFVDSCIPGPQGIQATIVNGVPRITWDTKPSKPGFPVHPFERLLIYQDGKLEVTIDGATGAATGRLEDIGQRKIVDFRIVCEIQAARGRYSITDFIAARRLCPPPSDHGSGTPGEVEFWLLGGHPPPSAGGGGIRPSYRIPGLGRELVQVGPGGATFTPQAPAEQGEKELSSGFELLQTAKKLRIAVHGTKVLGGLGAELCVQIKSADSTTFQPVERVVIPEEVPVLPIDEPKWWEITYNTEKPDPLHPGMTDPPLPPGYYHILVYARGGYEDRVHFKVSSDAITDQMLIPGVGCPPYPLVQVDDTTGESSPPQILGIEQFCPAVPVSGSGGTRIQAGLRAIVRDPDTDEDRIVQYTWRFGNTVKQSAAPTVVLEFPIYGYYNISLAVEDVRCGKAQATYEVKVAPPTICAGGTAVNFTFPTPKPADLHFVPGLSTLSNLSFTPAQVPARFRVYVVDPGACSGGTAQTTSVDFGLFDGSVLAVPALSGTLASAAGDNSAARFWDVEFPDMGRIDRDLTAVRLKARGRGSYGTTPWSDVLVYDTSKAPIAGSNTIALSPPPAYIGASNSFTSGTFDSWTRDYNFQVNALDFQGLEGFPTLELPSFTIPGTDTEIPLPPLDNGLEGMRLTARLQVSKGKWNFLGLQSSLGGQVLGGQVGGSSSLSGGTWIPDQLSFDYCSERTLFRESFSQQLFNAVLFAGLIGPIPVTITASVGLAIAISLETQTELFLHDDPANPFSAQFWLTPNATLGLDCAVRADILGGILNTTVGLIPQLSFDMPFYFVSNEDGKRNDKALVVTFSLDAYIRACIDLILFEACVSKSYGILEYSYSTNENVPLPSGCPSVPRGAGGGGQEPPVYYSTPDRQLSIASSPDGTRQVAVGIFDVYESRPPMVAYLLRTPQLGGWSPVPMETLAGSGADWLDKWQADPKVVFLDNDTVLLAWTQSFAHEDTSLTPGSPATVENTNKAMRRHEIVYQLGKFSQNGILSWQKPPLRVPPGERGRPAGRVTLAPIPGALAAAAAWVEMESEDWLAADGMVRMKETSIYARTVRFQGGGLQLGTRILLSELKTPAKRTINIEGSMAFAADGAGITVWVNDSIHEDLVRSNVGRNILSRRLVYAAGTLSPVGPISPVIQNVTGMPGILEPSIALKNRDYGMLAFTALPSNAIPEDTGLKNTRLLYAAKLIGGTWQEPILIYEKCDIPIFTHWPAVFVNPTVTTPAGEVEDLIHFTIVGEQMGPLGSPLGPGGVLGVKFDAAKDRWTAPVNLTPDGRIHQGLAATIAKGAGLVVLTQSPGPELPMPPGGGATAVLADDILASDFRISSDPSIVYLRISDPYAAPGAVVTASVGVANRGFASTPRKADGSSDLLLRLSLRDAEGAVVPAGDRVVPMLAPGEEEMLDLQVTMPVEPVRLVAAIDAVPGELDANDNQREAPLGTQPPRSLSYRLLPDGVVVLGWTNASLYERILVSRDGELVTELPGVSASFTDDPADPPADGADHYVYGISGVIRYSTSIPATIHVPLQPVFSFGFDGCPGAVVEGTPGEIETFEIFATLDSALPAGTTGATGWQMSMCIEGGTIQAIGVSGLVVTAVHDADGNPATPPVDPYPIALSSTANPTAETAVDPLDPSRSGAVSAVTLSSGNKYLRAIDSEKVARILVDVEVPPAGRIEEVVLRYEEGFKGRGQPMGNLVAVQGGTRYPLLGECRFRVRGAVGGSQRPGDINQDGVADISDAIGLLGYLFLGSPRELPCGDGSPQDPSNTRLFDFTGDRRVDISDAVGILSYLFLGGGPHSMGSACLPMAGCPGACGS